MPPKRRNDGTTLSCGKYGNTHFHDIGFRRRWCRRHWWQLLAPFFITTVCMMPGLPSLYIYIYGRVGSGEMSPGIIRYRKHYNAGIPKMDRSVGRDRIAQQHCRRQGELISNLPRILLPHPYTLYPSSTFSTKWLFIVVYHFVLVRRLSTLLYSPRRCR